MNLSVNEAIDMAQNRPEIDVYIWRYALIVVHARNDERTNCFIARLSLATKPRPQKLANSIDRLMAP